jgi:putative transposase
LNNWEILLILVFKVKLSEGLTLTKNYKIVSKGNPYLYCFRVMENLPIFLDEEICEIIIQNLNYMRGRGMLIYGYVIMPDHIHVIMQAEELSGQVESFKSTTAKQIVSYLGMRNEELFDKFNKIKKEYYSDNYLVWTKGDLSREILGREMMQRAIGFVHTNPSRANLVDSHADWKYTSYPNYHSGKGLMEVDLY